MELLRSKYQIVATAVFILFIIIAHIFSTSDYQWTKNTISDLGAQGYGRKAIMQTGFILFGVVLVTGILLNGFSWRTAPMLIYGTCVALTGIFCTKPFVEGTDYSTTASSLHSLFAQIAGISFSLGILIQIFFTPDKNLKLIHLLFFILVIGLSATFGILKNSQGIIQRILYLVSFVWLIKFYRP
jgi:hypothetical membrane protein